MSRRTSAGNPSAASSSALSPSPPAPGPPAPLGPAIGGPSPSSPLDSTSSMPPGAATPPPPAPRPRTTCGGDCLIHAPRQNKPGLARPPDLRLRPPAHSNDDPRQKGHPHPRRHGPLLHRLQGGQLLPPRGLAPRLRRR